MSCRDPGPQQLPKEEVRYGPTVNLVSGRLVAYNEDTCERVLGKLGPGRFLWQIGPRQIGPRQIGPPADWARKILGAANWARDHICHKQYKQRLCKIIITRVKVHFVDVF